MRGNKSLTDRSFGDSRYLMVSRKEFSKDTVLYIENILLICVDCLLAWLVRYGMPTTFVVARVEHLTMLKTF